MGKGNLCANSKDLLHERRNTLQFPSHSKEEQKLFSTIINENYNNTNPPSNLVFQNYYNNSNFITINSRKWYNGAPKKNIESSFISNNNNYILNLYNNKENSFELDTLHQENKFKSVNETINKNKNYIFLPFGDKYEGDLFNNKPHGKGKYFSSSGEIREGTFINGQLNGKGKMNLSNGIYIEGNFINDKLNGKGKSININGEI